MKFSQRYGYTPVKNSIQLEHMDSELRNSLWNCLEICYWNQGRGSYLNDSANSELQGICNVTWKDFFKKPLDTRPRIWPEAKSQLRHYFFSEAKWYQVYDFIEFIPNHDHSRSRSNRPVFFRHEVNEVLEREMSGYRFVEEIIVPITDQTEIGEIESAMNGKEQSANDHLHAALNLLSDRNDPDYPNSIKESISAVESLVKSTLGTEKGTLGDLLKEMDRRTPLHPAYKSALSSLYGYTSDEGGIRHGKSDTDREVTFEEAKFMLVVCSAFINYVRGSTRA